MPDVMPKCIFAGGRGLHLSQDTAAEQTGSGSQRKEGQAPTRLSRLGRLPGTLPYTRRLLVGCQHKALPVAYHRPTFMLGLQTILLHSAVATCCLY